MSVEKAAAALANQLDRRRLLGWSSKVALAFLLVLVGRKPEGGKAYHNTCSYNCIGCLPGGCCLLGYDRYCTSTEASECFRYDHSGGSWWVWSCCQGSTLYECYECCGKSCSTYRAYPNCCSGSAEGASVTC